MLLFQGDGKTVDYRSENFQQLSDSVVSLRFVDEAEIFGG